MRGKTREANPKRRRSAPDDRAVLIASLVFSCEAALSSQRKIRGSRKRGYKKPQVSCTPLLPLAPGGARSRRRRRPKRRSPSEGENPPSRGMGSTSPPASAPQYRRKISRSPSEREKGACPLRAQSPPSAGNPQYRRKIPRSPSEGEKALALRGRKSPGRVQLLRFSQQGEPQ